MPRRARRFATGAAAGPLRLADAAEIARLCGRRVVHAGTRDRGQHRDIFGGLRHLLRPLPFWDASYLVLLNETTPRVGDVSVSYPTRIGEVRSHSFAEMAAVNLAAQHGRQQSTENIGGLAVSPNFLPMMGVRPEMGRDSPLRRGKGRRREVVLLSYALWQSRPARTRARSDRRFAWTARRRQSLSVAAGLSLGREMR